MTAAIVRAEDFSYRYPKQERYALREINLEVAAGELIAVMGPTGAGKSTLCLALNGIVPHFYGGEAYGAVVVDGLDTAEHPTHQLAERVRLTFDDPEMQLTAPSVIAEVAFTLENLRYPPDEMRRRIAEALNAVRLDGLEAKHPHQLSGGQKQRLAIAAALALRPRILVLDEPTSQLDPVGSDEVFELARQLNADDGVTVILVTHATDAVAEWADRVVVLADGQVRANDAPHAVFQDLDLLRRHGIRPPDVSEVFSRLVPSGRDLPITLSDAVSRFESLRPAIELRAGTEIADDGGARSRQIVLSCRDLTYTYPDGTRALRGVDLDVLEGDYVAIVGQNGAGKSTLVRHFLHLLDRAGGEIFVQGGSIDDYEVSDLARHIGYVSQNPDNQIFTDSVEEEVAFALRNLKASDDEVSERVDAALAEMHLDGVRDRHPVTLSKGDRARVVIAAVLAMEPAILIFDEPTTGQDYQGARAILDITRELHASGRTIVLITHHLYLLPGYARRLVVMGDGAILADGPLRDGLYSTDTLARTFLTPPQLVQFVRAVQPSAGPLVRALTVDELEQALVRP